MSKITNEDLTQSGRGCFIAVPIWQQYRRHRVNYHKSSVLPLEYKASDFHRKKIISIKFRFWPPQGWHTLKSAIVVATVTAIVSETVVCRGNSRGNRRPWLTTVFISSRFIRRLVYRGHVTVNVRVDS